jgi:hypothetical protein
MQLIPNSKDTRACANPTLALEKLPRDAWRPSEANGQRQAPRTTEREIESVPAWIRSAAHPEWVSVKLWDYSNDGFGLLYSSNTGHSSFAVAGERVDLKLDFFRKAHSRREKGILIPCRIENAGRLEKGLRIGLRRLDMASANDEPESERIGDPIGWIPAGYLCDEVRPLSAKIRNPLLYNEWGEAKLRGVGPKTAFLFESSDPGLLIILGAETTIELEVPMDSKGTFSGTVTSMRLGPGRIVLFEVKKCDISFDLSNAVGEHYVQAEIGKPSRMAELGIRMKRFKDQFRFRFISTREEYRSILGLRHSAYAGAGKVDREATVDSHEDELDSRSRLLAAFHGDTIIASVALTFGTQGIPLRSETCFPENKYPVPIPAKDKLLEIRGLCTDQDYRGGDLIQGLFEHIARCVLFSDREWLITFATTELWPLYRRIGFRKTGASVEIHHLGGLTHHLIIVHRNTILAGYGMTPLAWNYFFGQMVTDLFSKGTLTLSRRIKSRIAFYSLFSGITRRWLRAKLERDFNVLLQKRRVKERNDDRQD